MNGWGKKKNRQRWLARIRAARNEARKKRAKKRRIHRARYGSTFIPSSSRFPKGKTVRTGYHLTFPSRLDFDDNLEETLLFFGRFRRLVDVVRPGSIRIDHSALVAISPAAALTLVGDVVRGASILDGSKWRGNAAANKQVHQLLGEVGYWDYFNGMSWEKSQSNSRQFLQHRVGNKTNGKVVKELIDHFLPELKLSEESKKTLYPAIIECMDNVMKHAYKISDKNEPYYHQWWLLGYRDLITHEVSFCFYDQGLSIPKTIRVRFKDQLGPFSKSDSKLIVKAVVDGHFSSTKDPARGRGLPTLKRFIDTAASGELMIVSHKSRCIFKRGGNAEQDFEQKFNGTLIVWRLQN